MKLAFYGGQTAGIIALLALYGTANQIKYAFPEDEGLSALANTLHVPIADKHELNVHKTIVELSRSVDLFICCHGRKILSKEFVKNIKCINLHPCLYQYKGIKPIERLIIDGNTRASVASHWMVEKIDAGNTIIEKFLEIPNIKHKTQPEVYAQLYPLYVNVLLQTLHLLA